MTDEEAVDFEDHRTHLLSVAYRIIGRWSEAEDVVQDAWLRWNDVDRTTIERPAAWLTTVTTRLAIDRLRSARVQREHYVGPWLPEPLATEPAPDEAAELADTLTFGFLVALEQLGPVERAVFVLREVFDLPYDEIAPVVERTVPACRQIARRARDRVRSERARDRAPARADVEHLLDACVRAALGGDIAALEQVFASDVVLVSDGGPDRHAARRPVVGRDRVARLLASLGSRVSDDVVVERRDVNAVPGLVFRRGDAPQMAVTIEPDVSGGAISRVWIVLNPDKLAGLTARVGAPLPDPRGSAGAGDRGGSTRR